MKRTLMAVDPGASGGIAVVYPNGKADAWAMGDDVELCENVREFRKWANQEGTGCVAYMELVGGYIGGPGAPGSAMFNFGDGYGYLRGLFAMAAIELHLVRPQTWQAGIPGVKGIKEKAVRKRALKEHAARLFPHLTVTLKTADALCIAAYAMQQEAGR